MYNLHIIKKQKVIAMSKSRFEVGKKYPFIGHIYKSKKSGNILASYSLFDNDDFDLYQTNLVLLECVSEHDVPIAYQDDSTAKGYIFKSDDGKIEYHNQFPTASYGQMSTTSDYIASAIVEIDGQEELSQLISVNHALEDILRLEIKYPDMVTDTTKEMKLKMIDFVTESGFKLNHASFVEGYRDFRILKLIDSDSNFSLNKEMNPDSVPHTQIQIVWVVAGDELKWFYTHSAAKKHITEDKSLKDGYLFPYAVSHDAEDELILGEINDFYNKIDKECLFNKETVEVFQEA